VDENVVFLINVREEKRQLRMDNPGTLATLVTQDTTRRQTKHTTQLRKLKR